MDEAQNSVDLRPALRLPAALPRLGVIRREVHEFEKLGQRGAGVQHRVVVKGVVENLAHAVAPLLEHTEEEF